jgi:hypothetical protein
MLSRICGSHGFLGFVLLLFSSAFLQGQQLWYWHHSLLKNTQAVQSSKALIDQAFSYGYTGVAFWDVSSEYIGTPNWDPSFPQYLQQAMNYAVSKGMKVIGTVAPFGYSNDSRLFRM